MATRIAHNVKNPLSSMKTLVQLMEEDATLPERAREDCRMVVAEVDRLDNNIRQILRYAKHARDTDQTVDLAGVVSRVLNLSRAEADRRQVRLEWESPAGSCNVKGGEEAASDIVSNLVVNALQASPAGTAVRVQMLREEAAGTVCLSVEDQGPGVAADLAAKIFQPFFTTRPGGTGLGLAIVARRVEEIGGQLDFTSPLSGEGRGGTCFHVRFRAAE
jgi:signal transduction histidine kinase